MPEIRVEFRVIGTDGRDDLDPDEITALLGIAPTKTWRIGKQRGVSVSIRHRNSAWILESGLPASADVEAHTIALLGRLAPVWPAAVAIGAQHYTEVAFVIFFSDDKRPALLFDNVAVKRIADLNAGIDVSLYYIAGGDEEAEPDGE